VPLTKDFKSAYNRLQQDLVKQEISGSAALDPVARHMIPEQSIADYLKNNNANASKGLQAPVYDRLYKDSEYIRKKREELH